jgi:hypothetical protein
LKGFQDVFTAAKVSLGLFADSLQQSISDSANFDFFAHDKKNKCIVVKFRIKIAN